MVSALFPRLVTAKSSFPSPLKSPTTSAGPAVAGGEEAGAKVPSPLPKRMVTVLTSKFATARSSFPSPLKSPIASPNGVPVAGGEETGVKVPSPGPEQNGESVVSRVRHRQIEFSIPGEISHGQGSWPSANTHRRARWGHESPIALAQQDGDAVIVIIRHRQVQLSIAINVSHRHGTRTVPRSRRRRNRREGSVAIAQENTHVAWVTVLLDSQGKVQLSVPVEVPRRHR